MKVLTGIRPTGRLHIGHYFSVIKPALEEGVDVLIAKYHTIATDKDVIEIENKLSSQGVNRNSVFYQQVDIDLYFKLLNASRFGELSRMTQFKSQKPTPHLFIYPVLMAHDLVGYDKVIVGEDQKQHVEYANVLFNRLKLPRIEGDYRGGRIMSLTDPTKKMSKSEPKGCLFLDNPDLRHAVTTPEGVKNLANIYKELTGNDWDTANNEKMKRELEEAVTNLQK